MIAKVQAENSNGWSSESSPSSSGALLNTVPIQMSAPTVQTKTHNSVTVQFSSLTSASDRGGLTISKYVLEYKKSTDATYTTVDPATSPQTVSSLVPDTQYLFTVKAINSIGEGLASTTLSVTTNTYTPDVPTGVTTTESANGLSVDITWTAGDDNG